MHPSPQTSHFKRLLTHRPSAEQLDWARRASNYGFPEYFRPESRFTVSDAISLGVLLAHEAQEGEGDSPRARFYRRASAAVTRALSLPEPERLQAWLDRMRPTRQPDEAAALRQAVHVRSMLIAFQDEWGEQLEGDLWGLRRGTLEPGARAEVEALRAWYGEAADGLLRGLERADRAVCALLGWPASGADAVTYAALRERFDYPDVEAEWDELFCP